MADGIDFWGKCDMMGGVGEGLLCLGGVFSCEKLIDMKGE